jgi:hypothetical protein
MRAGYTGYFFEGFSGEVWRYKITGCVGKFRLFSFEEVEWARKKNRMVRVNEGYTGWF